MGTWRCPECQSEKISCGPIQREHRHPQERALWGARALKLFAFFAGGLALMGVVGVWMSQQEWSLAGQTIGWGLLAAALMAGLALIDGAEGEKKGCELRCESCGARQELPWRRD